VPGYEVRRHLVIGVEFGKKCASCLPDASVMRCGQTTVFLPGISDLCVFETGCDSFGVIG